MLFYRFLKIVVEVKTQMEGENQDKKISEDSFKVPNLPNLGNEVKTTEEQSQPPDPI